MSEHHQSPEQPPQAVSRLGLYLPVGLLALVALTWCGFWFYSAQLTEAAIVSFKANETAQGRQWDCADQKVAGFPFRIELHCSSVTLSTSLDARPTVIKTGALHAATQIYSPNLALADLDGPLVVESNGAVTTASWDNLRVSVRFSKELERLSLVAAGPRVEIAQVGAEKVASAARTAEAHIRVDSGRPAQDRAIDLAVLLNEASSPILDAALGTSDKLNLAISGVATQLARTPVQGWRNLLEEWRNAGGVFLVESGKVAKGELQVEGKGALNLDAMRRVAGKLDVSAKGLGPLMARFGVGGLSQMIGPLLTRKDGSTTQWPLLLQEGRIQLGPLRTGPVLGPLY